MSQSVHRESAVRTLAFVLAFCSIVYELLIAKTVARLCGDAMLWESVTIGVFVLGMGVGAVGRLPDDLAARLVRLARIELVLTLIGGTSVAAILYMHMGYRIYGYDEGLLRDQLLLPPVYVFGTAVQLVTLMVGVLTGAELPIILSIAPAGSGTESGRLASYYFGTLAGTLATPSLVLTQTDAVRVAVAVGALNLVAAVSLLVVAVRGSLKFTWLGLSLGVAACLGGLAVASPRLYQLHLGNLYYNRYAWSGTAAGEVQSFFPVGIRELSEFLADYPAVRRIQSPYQQIDLVPEGPSPLDAVPERDGETDAFSLFIDGRFQVSSATAADYHEALAHVPVMAHTAPPRRILVLGAGDGILVKELLKYGEAIESITMIEFDEEMLKVAREHPPLLALNGGALSDPKVKVIVDDAFRFLRATTDRFDAVFMDLTFPFEFESARLYSAEFLGLAAKTLEPEGYMVLPSPVDFAADEGGEFVDVVYSTLHAAGFRRMLAYHGTRDAFVLATKEPTSFTLDGSSPSFPLTTIASPFFEADNFRPLSGEFDPKAVHTLLKPKLIRMEDSFF